MKAMSILGIDNIWYHDILLAGLTRSNGGNPMRTKREIRQDRINYSVLIACVGALGFAILLVSRVDAQYMETWAFTRSGILTTPGGAVLSLALLLAFGGLFAASIFWARRTPT